MEQGRKVCTRYSQRGARENWQVLVKTPDGFSVQPQSTALLLKALATTVFEVRRLGKRVILAAPPPASPFDTGRCLERMTEGKPTITDHPDCTYTLREYRGLRREVLSFLDQVRAQNAAQACLTLKSRDPLTAFGVTPASYRLTGLAVDRIRELTGKIKKVISFLTPEVSAFAAPASASSIWERLRSDHRSVLELLAYALQFFASFIQLCAGVL